MFVWWVYWPWVEIHQEKLHTNHGAGTVCIHNTCTLSTGFYGIYQPSDEVLVHVHCSTCTCMYRCCFHPLMYMYTVYVIIQVDISRVTTLCQLLEGLLCSEKNKVDWKAEASKLHPLISTTFLFSYVWSLGGNLVEKSLELFENYVRTCSLRTTKSRLLLNNVYNNNNNNTIIMHVLH